VQAAAGVLLKLPLSQRGADAQLFRQALAECQFREYNMDGGPLQRHAQRLASQP
jgi:hypothetical protein